MPFLLPTAHTSFTSEHLTRQTTPPGGWRREMVMASQQVKGMPLCSCPTCTGQPMHTVLQDILVCPTTARKTSVHKSFPVWKLWSFPAVSKPGNEPSFQAWKLPLSTIACTCGYLGNLVHFQTWELLGNSIVSKLGNSCALMSFLLCTGHPHVSYRQ